VDLAVRIADPDESLRLLGQVVEAMPGDLFALELLAATAHRLGNDAAAAASLERLGEGAREPDARVALLRAAIGARVRQGAEPAGSFGLYQRMVEVDPASDTVATLERLALRRGDWPRVVAARRMLADTATDDRTRALRLWELGDARAEVGDRRGAIADLERARELAPDLPPIRRVLARFHERAGAFRSAAEALVEVGRGTKVPARAAAAFRRAARLYAESVRDDDGAARALEDLLALEPEAEVDFQVLEVILKHRGETDRLIEVARRRAAATSAQPSARRDRLMHLAELLHDRRPNDAVVPLQEAVALDPLSVPALSALAELLAELGRAAEAVATLRRVIAAAADGRVVSAAWSRIGQIAGGALGDTATAIAAYRSALVAAPEDVGALSGLTQALLRQRDYGAAAQVLRRLAAVDPDRQARVGHWITLGEVLSGPGRDAEGAAEALEKALELDPANGVALDRLDAVLADLDDPHRFARALSRHLEADPSDIARRVRLARLWRGALAAPERAADELRIVVQQAPTDVGARAELAAVLEEAGRTREAAIEHLAVLGAEPIRLDSLRSLRRLYERLGEARRAAVVTAVLVALGAADPEDQRALRDARARYSEEPRGNITAADFENVLRHPGERHPATLLLGTLIEVIPRLHPVSLDEWGITRADRLGARSDDPMRPMVQRLATMLGIEEAFEVYLARAGIAQVELEATFPPSLLVPATLAITAPPQEVTLQVSRQLGRLRAGTYLAGRLSARELGVVLAAALRSRYPEYGRGLASEDVLVELAQRVGRLVPRRHRRAFERLVTEVAEAGPLDVNRWRQAMVHTSHRVSLVISGDVLGCLEYVIRADRRLAAAAPVSPAELAETARTSPEIVEVIAFVLGDDYLAMRDRIA
jgi:tetratricopeptide (TPR) repeat protein